MKRMRDYTKWKTDALESYVARLRQNRDRLKAGGYTHGAHCIIIAEIERILATRKDAQA